MKRKRLIVFLILFFSLFNSQIAHAQNHIIVTTKDLNRVAKQLYAPGHNGMTADYCPLPTAATMRQEIVDLLRQGFSDKEILVWMAERYGEQALAVPEKRGFNLTLWIFPVTAVATGIAILLLYIRNKYRKPLVSELDLSTKPSLVDTFPENEIEKIELRVKRYLTSTYELDYVHLEQHYKDLVDLEYDYMSEKISHSDYLDLKSRLHQLILENKQ